MRYTRLIGCLVSYVKTFVCPVNKNLYAILCKLGEKCVLSLCVKCGICYLNVYPDVLCIVYNVSCTLCNRLAVCTGCGRMQLARLIILCRCVLDRDGSSCIVHRLLNRVKSDRLSLNVCDFAVIVISVTNHCACSKSKCSSKHHYNENQAQKLFHNMFSLSVFVGHRRQDCFCRHIAEHRTPNITSTYTHRYFTTSLAFCQYILIFSSK